MKQQKVAIITTTYTQRDKVLILLRSIENHIKYKNYRVYFLDDSNKGIFEKEVKKRFPKVRVFSNKRNLGFSISNNILIKKSIEEYNPDYFLLLNDDTKIIETSWLIKFIKIAESIDGGIFGCRIYNDNLSNQLVVKKGKILFYEGKKDFKKDKLYLETQEVDNIIGACFLIKREVINDIELLDEGFSPAYGEDTDFCYRAKKKGYKSIYVGELSIVHSGHSSAKTLDQKFLWYLKKRNSIRLEWKHFPLFKIFYYTLIHFGSTLKGDKKLFISNVGLLIKAYIYNFKRINEIKMLNKDLK